MNTVLRYAGGKSKAYKKITPFIPKNTKKIVSPFIGGGSMEVKWASELGIEIVGYDIFYHLVNF
jgi:DNA adenine methylase